ncbi:MAG TPA: hypothetical protein VD788_17655, partial [Candidatus Polarisedimenticolaceae bacterium]|nr:hypothetical protein [Candidatus Polarisedimenticolaceae bacterium]
SALHTDQNIAVKDIVVPPGVRLLDDPETIVAVVAELRIEEEPVPEVAAGEAAAAAEGAAPAEAGEKEEGGES